MPEFDPMPRDAETRTRPLAVDSDDSDRGGGDGTGRRPGGGGAAVAAAFLIVAALAGVAWWKLRPGSGPRPAAPVPAPDGGASAPAGATAPTAADEPPLPSLDASDGYVRELGATLSSDSALAAWLAHDDLVRRFVAAVANVAEGASPATHVPFLRPSEPFRTLERGGRIVVDPVTFRRHDRAVGLLASLDARGCARGLRRLAPLFGVAWRELGDPRRDFEETLAAAITRLAAVPVPEGEIEVVADGAVWAFADADLERRPAAEKLLLRLGSDNARRLQAWLRELAAARGSS